MPLIFLLFNKFEDLTLLKNELILIQEEYGSYFEYSDKLEQLKLDNGYFLRKNNKYYFFVPKIKWLNYRNNLEEYNISYEHRIKKIAEKNAFRNKLEKFRSKRAKKLSDKRQYDVYKMLEGLNSSLNYIYYDPEMFEFEEINDINALDFLKILYNVAEDKLIEKNNHESLVKISKAEFFEIAGYHKFNPQDMYNILVSSRKSVKKFPILIEQGNNIILCPETIFIVLGVLDYKFNQENINNLLTGDEFENYVAEKFKKLCFSLTDPKNPKLSLKGRKIKDTMNKERQIDLIVYNDSTILVVECKDQGLWRIDPKIMWKKRKEYRIRDIKKEIDNKHLHRVQFVKDNYKNYFGFKKDYTVEGVLVTRIKEDIEEYNGVKIICGYELGS